MRVQPSLDRSGYVVCRGLLERAEANEWSAHIRQLSGLGDEDFRERHFECPDGVSRNREFWPLIFHERLLLAIRELLGPTARYTQHSDLHAHRTGGWHRDSACREFGVGPDWDESRAPYRMVRVAIYLQSYAESGSALGVLPGSHRLECGLSPRERRYWRLRDAVAVRGRLRGRGRFADLPDSLLFRTRRGVPYVTPPVEPVWIPTEPGDCVIFDQRLYHTASPIHGPKYAIYLSYGADNEHSRNHMQYYLHHRRDLGYDPLEPELVEQLTSAGLYMPPSAAAEVAGFTTVS